MIVAAIIVIGITLAAPSFSQFLRQDRIISTSNQIHSLLKFARSEAVKRETSLAIRVVDDSWRIIEHIGQADEQIIQRYEHAIDSVDVGLVNVDIRSSGEFSQALDISIADNDSSTTNYRLCALISGQTRIEIGTNSCS